MSVYWLSFPINTTITAATVVTVINTRTNATRKSTIYNDLPSGFTLPDVNADGTRVTTITTTDYFARNYTTVLAFPTIFLGYPNSYEWSGILPTPAGNEPCTSVKYHAAPLPSHVPAPSPTVAFPIGDAYGTNFQALRDWLPGDHNFFKDSFPDVLAFQVCTPFLEVAGEAVWPTASYLTESSVSYEGNDPATVAGGVPADSPVVPKTVEASPTPAASAGSPIIAPAAVITPAAPLPVHRRLHPRHLAKLSHPLILRHLARRHRLLKPRHLVKLLPLFNLHLLARLHHLAHRHHQLNPRPPVKLIHLFKLRHLASRHRLLKLRHLVKPILLCKLYPLANLRLLKFFHLWNLHPQANLHPPCHPCLVNLFSLSSL
ncbi:MAG: hypothetical protein M1826_005965 [Phylliscum demangeonii]|nr:MAG: hypothetical protein M1826_005965 [Phylliscum demangeonii]